MQTGPIAKFALAFCLTCLPASNPQAAPAGGLAGRVTDAESGIGLPGAAVVLLNTGLGTETDAEGRFTLKGLPPGTYTVSISMVGYTPRTLKDRTLAPGDTLRLSVRLSPAVLELPALVVSTAKRPKSIVDAPTSVSVLGGQDLRDDNIVSLDESLETVPGVHLVSGQVNIRGSSGYSRGTGSRVLLLIDGFPALSADNAEVKWDAIPLDQVARVEIIKGAGSALYGAGALGGIVNIITRDPSPVPETRFRILGGTYSDPAHPEWEWASGRRYTQSLDISHSRQTGNLGFILGLGQKWTNGYKENAWYKRYSGFGKFRYAFKPTATLTATANWALDDHGVFIQWKDRNEPLEVALNSRNDKTISQKFNLNLDFYHLLGSQTGYRIKTYAYRTDFDNQVEGKTGSEAVKLGQELQLDLQPASAFSLTLGAEWIADRVRSSPDLFGNHNSLNLAAYLQAELEPSDRLSLSAGGRFDRARTDGRPAEKRFSPKLGLSYRLTPQTSLRSTLGRGFRSPSIAEIYTSATFSAVPIVPNTGLSAEHSLSWEAGLNHHLKPGLHLDLAVFWSRYRDLVEARPNAAGVVSFRNVSKGRIAGLETSLLASWRFLTLDATYTYMNATEDLTGGSEPLPYRPRHIAGSGLRANLGAWTLETRFRYRSRILRASGLFPEGTRDLIALYILDLSATRSLGPVDATFKIHNALEYNYAKVERNPGAPRLFSFSISGDLQ